MDVFEVSVKLGEKTYEMPVNFEAAMKVSQKIGDPLNLIRLWTRGDDSWITTENTVKILLIGLKCAGEDFEFNELGELIFKNAQINDASAAAGKYVSMLATAGRTGATKSRSKKKAEQKQ